ncbi:MAG: cytochrome P450 [Proteobacteria bacterium]|nr:cytochrome P450 [Pseudomonadota bacterium]
MIGGADMTAPAIEAAALYPPRVTPPAGPLPVWRFLPQFLINPLRTLPERVYDEPFFAPPSMGGRVAWVTEPALVERILLDEHQSFPKSPIEDRIFNAVLGTGILTAEGESWRWQRRTVAPLFRPADLAAFVPAMSAVAERLVARWRRERPGRTLGIDRDMTDVTFDVLAATLFPGATAEEEAALKRHIGAYLEHTSWDVAFELLSVPRWVWHPAKGPMRRHARVLDETMRGILERERAKGFPGGGLMASLGRARDPETGEPMSERLIVNNLLTFAAAGHETTAKALTWTLYLLARAPIWADRVAAEVRRVAGAGPIEARHLDDLVVTRQVLKESMRLFPPAPVLGRMATKPVSLGAHILPTGAMVVIPVWAIHRHRALWTDPDRFDPERFTPENEKRLARTQFMPFGFGPRICVGMSFAMMEGVTLLATFVRAMRFAADETLAPEPVSRVTLRPKGGMPLRVSARES